MISDPKKTETGLVEEVPGYYGSVKIEESVAQRIWSEQDFFTDSLVTNCGKKYMWIMLVTGISLWRVLIFVMLN